MLKETQGLRSLVISRRGGLDGDLRMGYLMHEPQWNAPALINPNTLAYHVSLTGTISVGLMSFSLYSIDRISILLLIALTETIPPVVCH